MKLGLSLSLSAAGRGGARLDPDTAAYIAATGATDIAVLDSLAKYMRKEGLAANYRLYPLKAAQNYGSGTSAGGLGGLTSEPMTLHAAPTWGTSGMAFAAASSQYGSIPDFIDASTFTQFLRANIATATASDHVLIGQRQSSPEARSFWLATNTNNINVMARTSSGNVTTGNEVRTNGDNLSGVERTFVTQFPAGGTAQLWWDKTTKPLTLLTGTAQTNHANVASLVTIMAGIAAGAPIFPTSGTVVAALWVKGALSDEQRETITDLVNAL